MNDNTKEYDTFGASRIQVEPGVYRVTTKTPTFFKKIPNKELYRAAVGERIRYEDAQGFRIDRDTESGNVMELPGPSYRKKLPSDSEARVQAGVTIINPEDFAQIRLVPVEFVEPWVSRTL